MKELKLKSIYGYVGEEITYRMGICDGIRHEINACRRVMKEEANKTREHVVCSNRRLLGHVKVSLKCPHNTLRNVHTH